MRTSFKYGPLLRFESIYPNSTNFVTGHYRKISFNIPTRPSIHLFRLIQMREADERELLRRDHEVVAGLGGVGRVLERRRPRTVLCRHQEVQDTPLRHEVHIYTL